MIECRCDLLGRYRPTHDVRDACGHQSIGIDFFDRFGRQHDRQPGRCRMQRCRQFERADGGSELSHDQRVEPPGCRAACGQRAASAPVNPTGS